MEDDLVVGYPLHEAPGDPDPDGRLDDARSRRAVRHAQRAAEAANLEIHRNTFRYSKLIEEQRRVVLERRDRVLHGDAALTDLARRCPDRYQELAAEVGPGVLEESTRQIALYHLDRGWADHLAVLAEIREGIHLRALGHGPNPFIMALDPLSEFHAEAVKLFGRLLEQIGERCAATFEAAAITSAGIDLAAADLKRPTATWTYVVQDNPFGSDAERAGRRLRGLMHGASG
jgi:preprotein translocase subunit SecA